ncbi:MAG: hypothetical protein ACRYG7_44940 [Janthinobacterium lividum]
MSYLALCFQREVVGSDVMRFVLSLAHEQAGFSPNLLAYPPAKLEAS